ncbi:hypothetical protein OS493_000697 [Desmophyllum pertusum]|uniref:Uncharacterized protein n=1 Tax=Desmophyllum pertusum TaxID=174260 RepID=A0A9X0A7N6_9CNID|nr:hypothetical protein OS493_000697 [Desmophyllum pertusum]
MKTGTLDVDEGEDETDGTDIFSLTSQSSLSSTSDCGQEGGEQNLEKNLTLKSAEVILMTTFDEKKVRDVELHQQMLPACRFLKVSDDLFPLKMDSNQVLNKVFPVGDNPSVSMTDEMAVPGAILTASNMDEAGPSSAKVEINVTPEIEQRLKDSLRNVQENQEQEEKRKQELKRKIIRAKRLTAQMLLLSKEMKHIVKEIEDSCN